MFGIRFSKKCPEPKNFLKNFKMQKLLKSLRALGAKMTIFCQKIYF